jgi:hypothetical protein
MRSRGLWVIALLHKNPGKISLENSEQEPAGREKLQRFRDKVSKGRLVKFWENATELPGLVSRNLSHAVSAYPAVGWVRANRAANEDVLSEINELRKHAIKAQRELVAQKAEIDRLKSPPLLEGLAALDEEVTLPGQFTVRNSKVKWEFKTTWRKIFAYVSPFVQNHPDEDDVSKTLAAALFAEMDTAGYSPFLKDQSFQTVAVQLRALGLVEIAYPPRTSGPSRILSRAAIWSLTPAGERLMIELRTVHSSAKQK